jgi:uncharacterized protein
MGKKIRMKIRIRIGELSVEAELNEAKTAQKIWEALPIEGKTNLWGEEIYFSIPIHTEQEPGAKETVSCGELGYWPPGHAFCVFFGPTPASRGEEIRAASPVTIIGKVLGDPKVFRKANDGAKITLEKTQDKDS